MGLRPLEDVLVVGFAWHRVVYDERYVIVCDGVSRRRFALRVNRATYVTFRIFRLGVGGTNFLSFVFEGFRNLLAKDANVLRSFCGRVMRIT